MLLFWRILVDWYLRMSITTMSWVLALRNLIGWRWNAQMLKWNVNKAMWPKCSINCQNDLVDHHVIKTMWVLNESCMCSWSHDQIPNIKAGYNGRLVHTWTDCCSDLIKTSKWTPTRLCKYTMVSITASLWWLKANTWHQFSHHYKWTPS